MAVRLSNLSAIWATSASTVNTAILMNVTDTISAANSNLIDLQVSGNSKFSVNKYGNVISEIVHSNSIVANTTYSNTSVINQVQANIFSVNSMTATNITATSPGFTANGYIVITPQDGTFEGGQIVMKGADSYDDWNIDSYADYLRFYTLSSNTNTFAITNYGAGSVNMTLDGNMTVDGHATVATMNLVPSIQSALDVTNSSFTRYTLFTTSGTLTIPTTVSIIFAIVIGGGGGGGGFSSIAGAGGGFGGITLGFSSVTPGSVIQIGVGTGGAGSNTTTGGSGGTSNVGTLTATGGTGGTAGGGGARGGNGVGANGTLNSDVSSFFGTLTQANYMLGASMLGSNALGKWEYLYIGNLSSSRSSGVGLSSNTPYVSLTTTTTPGSGGAGETAASGNDASGGIDGVVAIFY